MPQVQPVDTAAAAPVFDAKAMVASQRRKVDNPVYGQLPVISGDSQAAIEAARARMREQRRRNRRFGTGLLVVLAAIVLGGGAGLYVLFRADQRTGQPAPTTAPAAADGEQAGPLTPLGEQGQVIDAIDDVYSGAVPSAEGMLDAIEDAKRVVGQTNADVTRDPTVDSTAPAATSD